MPLIQTIKYHRTPKNIAFMTKGLKRDPAYTEKLKNQTFNAQISLIGNEHSHRIKVRLHDGEKVLEFIPNATQGGYDFGCLVIGCDDWLEFKHHKLMREEAHIDMPKEEFKRVFCDDFGKWLQKDLDLATDIIEKLAPELYEVLFNYDHH